MPKLKVIPLLEIIFQNKGGSSEIWKTINDLLNNRENEIPVFCTYIKHKINGFDKKNSLLALDLIDFCVDNGNMPLWSNLNSNDFLTSLITNLKNREDSDIQSKILFLIEKWGKKFGNSEELSNFQNVYMLLKKNNVEFPNNIESDYYKYVKYIKCFAKNNKIDKKETDPENYLRDIHLDLNTTSYEKKYKRLVNKLYDWTHDIHEINVLINKNNGGINNNKIAGLAKDLSRGNKQLIETIQSGRLKDEGLMNISLNVSNDIDMSLKRWSNHKKGIFPNPFISSFFQNKNKEINDNSSNGLNYSYNNYSENKINSNNLDLKDFFNINNSSCFSNKNMNLDDFNKYNTIENNNKNSFNLLADFEYEPAPNCQSNNSNNFDLHLNNKDNINSFFNLVAETEKKNQAFNKTINISNQNYNNKNNFKTIKNNIDFDDKYKNNINNFEKNDFESNNENLKDRQSLMYPSFEELNQV